MMWPPERSRLHAAAAGLDLGDLGLADWSAASVRQVQSRVRTRADGMLGPATAAAAAALVARVGPLLPLAADIADAGELASRPRRAPPRAIVIHHTATASPPTTLRVLRRRALSTHYEVGPDGAVHRYVDAALVAQHAGAANAWTIGIDLTHRSGRPWPGAQVEAAGRLLAELCAAWGIPAGVAPEGARYRSAEDVPADVGILRHRSVAATACPEDAPLERMAAWRPGGAG